MAVGPPCLVNPHSDPRWQPGAAQMVDQWIDLWGLPAEWKVPIHGRRLRPWMEGSEALLVHWMK